MLPRGRGAGRATATPRRRARRPGCRAGGAARNWPRCRKSRCRPHAAKPAAPADGNGGADAGAIVASAPPPAVAADEVKVAADRGHAGAGDEAAAAPRREPSAADTPSPEANIAATKIATLGGPAVIIDETAAANAADAKPDRSAIRKRPHSAPGSGDASRRGAPGWRRATGGAGRSTAGQSVRANRKPRRAHSAVALFTGHAGPVAIGGPSGSPHSDHEPS